MKWLIFVIIAGIVFQTAKGHSLKVTCIERSTGVQPIGADNGELIYLDRHVLSCPNGFLRGFRFVRSGLTDAFYRYTCCRYYLE